MTQKEIDLIFNITIILHEDEYFNIPKPWFSLFQFNKSQRRDRNETQKWVAEQLATAGIYTVPVGMSWGVLTTEEYYKHSKNTYALQELRAKKIKKIKSKKFGIFRINKKMIK